MAWDYNGIGNIQMKKDNNRPQDKRGKGWLLLIMIAGLLYVLLHNPKNTDQDISTTDTIKNFASNTVKSLSNGTQQTPHQPLQAYTVEEDKKIYQDTTDQVQTVKEYYPDLNNSNIRF